MEEIEKSEIAYIIVLPMRGPIEPGSYSIGEKILSVSYPSEIAIGFPTAIQLPINSTRFDVVWTDASGQTQADLLGSGFERYLPLEEALSAINKLVEAFKLVRVGHADGYRLRYVGKADTLLYTVTVAGRSVGILNSALDFSDDIYPWGWRRNGDRDPHKTTELAKDHIGADTHHLARRFLRCFGLSERGYHTEALIVAHSILDDTVQTAIEDLLLAKGIADPKSRKEITRSIKETRLKIYLGSLLKLLHGRSLSEMWGPSDKCLGWLNDLRNKVAHRGGVCGHADAAWAIFASMRLISVLAHNGVLAAEFPAGMMRSARIEACWTNGRPSWVPDPDEVEFDEFDPHAAKREL